MEIAVIDWKNLDSRFVKDDSLEHFKAPQWVDLSAPDDSVDDEAWFCRPDCNHPKTVDDFYRAGATPPSKLQRSATVSENHLMRERIRRGKALQATGLFKEGGVNSEDSENKNPNLRTPPRLKAKLTMKDAIKSSEEKKKKTPSVQKEPTQRLRSTQSARNLFSGVDLLNKVSEFCNELKKLTIRGTSEKERVGNKNVERTPLMEKEKGKVPLQEQSTSIKKDDTPTAKNILKEKQRKKLQRSENAENTPITIDVKSSKRGGDDDILSQIRTYPPTPQCFSESRGGPTKATPPRSASSRPPQERGVLQELGKQSSSMMDYRKEKSVNKINPEGGGGASSTVTENEARGLDVFWFLKPCTLSS
ncbi:unnamed protein product [Cuscuta europaea]|uniref:Uncharacterized protein n=1 Tax=Cuscuta europaea TaxID=41803 RepID=A0A9P0ZDL3_CUSEU|nr:unnamed protein product [Cuscuta europaea]